MTGGNIGMKSINYDIMRKSWCIGINLSTALLKSMMIYYFHTYHAHKGPITLSFTA